MKFRPGNKVRHFKGNVYTVICYAIHTETQENLVIYKAEDGGCKIYARPVEIFESKIDRQKYPDAHQEYRFELL